MHSIESAKAVRWEGSKSHIESSDAWTKLVFRKKVDSTNSFIRREAGLKQGVVVVAETQTRGRGKGDHSWVSPKGGLWFSALIDAWPRRLHQNLYVGVLKGIRRALRSYGVTAEISRPNDLVAQRKKIGGILLEEDSRGIIMGVGLNVNNDPHQLPGELSRDSTALRQLKGHKVDLDKLLRTILTEIEGVTFDLNRDYQ
ncbi:MAG: biotin--[acetyl-CoA-carboxylase] ligase [Candidatus Bipolaricaulota bacterium]